MRYDHLSYLMDTDWVIYYLRNSNADVVKRIREYQPHGIGISIITLAELYAGVYYAQDIKKAEKTLKNFISGVDIVLFTPEVAIIYGHEYARL
ncbi:type II toxin-antitoxin system VapC family toxin [candidate division CSSED10-310 bacterium]|uniref:Type II toxin-antitoxin system VapC family toxin n=1 Tax=candidate division CSSED10-310 bacterium TaxID=2855610 RepID=A0ABV6YZY6_UNCC1